MINCKLIFLLIGVINLTRCDILSYDLNNRDVTPQKINKTEHVSKVEPTSLNNKVVDDKNLSKRRSYYSEREDERNLDFNFWQRQNNFDANSNFENPLRKNVYQNINGDMGSKFNEQQGNLNWEKEKSRLFYTNNVKDPLNSGNKLLGELYGSRNKVDEKLEWEKSLNFYSPSKIYATKESGDLKFPLNRLNNNREMENFNGGSNEVRVSSNNQNLFQSQYDKPKDLASEKEMVTGVLSRFHIPSPFYHPLNNDFTTEGTEFCKPEKAIIINLKTECPISKRSRSRVVHKYLLPPKTHLNTSPSQMIPSNLYYSSDRSTPFYY